MKTTITVSKKFTVNTGNYSSVQPSVSLTVHDVPLKDVVQIHRDLDIIADGLIHEQIESDSMTMGVMKKIGIGKYFNEIDKEQMKSTIMNSIKNIIEVGE